jgi:hypothetical protein
VRTPVEVPATSQRCFRSMQREVIGPKWRGLEKVWRERMERTSRRMMEEREVPRTRVTVVSGRKGQGQQKKGGNKRREGRRTGVEARQTSCIVSLPIHLILPHHMRLTIPRHLPTQAHVDPMNPHRPIRRRTRNAMTLLEHAHASDFPTLLKRLSRFRSNVLLESHGIPDLDRSIFRARREEKLVRRDDDGSDGRGVLGEVGDEGSFGAGRGAVSRGEGGAEDFATRDTDGDMRTEFGKWLAVAVEVGTLEELLDAGVITLCSFRKISRKK